MDKLILLSGILLLSLLFGCNQEEELRYGKLHEHRNSEFVEKDFEVVVEEVNLDRFYREPSEWGEFVTGVKTRF